MSDQPLEKSAAVPAQAGPAHPLARSLGALRSHRWKILSFIAASIATTFAVSTRITPIYEATATVDLDRQLPSGIFGQDSAGLSSDSDQFLATQVDLIQSDSVVRPVAQKFKLIAAGASKDAPVTLSGLEVTRPPNTSLLAIRYRSADPRLAADVANAITRSFIEHSYGIRYQAVVDLSSFMEKQIEDLKGKMERSSATLARVEREQNATADEKTGALSARLTELNAAYSNA